MLDADARQRQLFGVLRRLMQRSSVEQPAVFLIEDLHWLDSGSEAWVAEWVDAAAGTANLVVVNFRPEYRAEWMQRSHYQQLTLAPLGPEAIRELLTAWIGDDPSTAGLAEAIHARTGGNPFFAEEVVQSLIETAALGGERGAYRLATSVERLEVPATVQALLSARIDGLAEREKQVLQAAAVIGKEFSEPVLARVCEVSAAELPAALVALRSAEFLHEVALYPEAQYAFKHPLTHEVALGSQLKERRRARHAAVARAIEELHTSSLEEHAPLIAHHWEQAGDALAAARWHHRAARWVTGKAAQQALHHWRSSARGPSQTPSICTLWVLPRHIQPGELLGRSTRPTV